MGTIARGAKAGGGTNFNSGQIIDPAEVNTDLNTAYSEINGALDDGNIETATIPGAKSLRGTEISAPSSPSSNDILLYAFDSGGVTYWQSKDSSGRVILLGKQILPGTSTSPASATAVLVSAIFTQTGADTNETNVINYSMPGGTMGTDLDHIEYIVRARTAANGNTKRFRMYFGGTTVLDTGAQAWNGQSLVMRCVVTRNTATTQIGAADWIRTATGTEAAPNAMVAGLTTPGETLANAITLKVTILNGTANAGDCVVSAAQIRYYPAT